MSCDALGVKPEQCIYLDDLGINLKPAREIGMTTIKVIDPTEAINEVKKYLQLA
jgi:putative hydrolase of the HAD superfamily